MSQYGLDRRIYNSINGRRLCNCEWHPTVHQGFPAPYHYSHLTYPLSLTIFPQGRDPCPGSIGHHHRVPKGVWPSWNSLPRLHPWDLPLHSPALLCPGGGCRQQPRGTHRGTRGFLLRKSLRPWWVSGKTHNFSNSVKFLSVNSSINCGLAIPSFFYLTFSKLDILPPPPPPPLQSNHHPQRGPAGRPGHSCVYLGLTWTWTVEYWEV